MKIQDSKESKEDETEEYEDPFRQPILSQINLTPLPETYDGQDSLERYKPKLNINAIGIRKGNALII